MELYDLVEIDSLYIIGAIIAAFSAVFTQQRIIWNKLCKLARIAKRIHPKEAEIEKL